MSSINWDTATLAEMKAEMARRFDEAPGGPVCFDCGGETGMSDELCPVHAAEAVRAQAIAERARAAQTLARDRARARELYEAAGRPVPEWAR